MSIVIALVVFSVIILFHEFGHFLLAKMHGIVVTEFSLGMGPRLLSTVKGDTRYSLKLLPFGGSCMMLGEDDAEDTEGSFNSKGVWARISVIAAGPVFNFILAFVLAVIIISVVGYDPATTYGVEEGSPAAEAGLQDEDLITEFQGEHVDIGRDVNTYLSLYGVEAGDEVSMTYERDGVENSITFTPASVERYMLGFTYNQGADNVEITEISKNQPLDQAGVKAGDVIVAIDGNTVTDAASLQAYLEAHPLENKEVEVTYLRDGLDYKVNVIPKMTATTNLGFYCNYGRVKTDALGVLKYSAVELKYWIKTTVKSLGLLITGKFGIKDMSGPVGVVDYIGETYEASRSEGALMTWMNMFNMIILLSANLGVMNLLPIPALDGGRLVFLIIEAIRGKAINREAEGMVHFVGLMLLMVLMVFVMYNDISKLF